MRVNPPLAATVIVAAFVALGLSRLDAVPLVNGDEPWIAEPGYRFWTEGRFGCDMLAGFFGSERRCVGFLPVFPLLSGGAIALAGPSLAPMRVPSLALGVLALVATYTVGRRLIGPWHGVWAVAFLALWPVAAPGSSYPLGVPLLDTSRLARYDIGTAAFGLAAVLAAIGGDAARRPRVRAATRAFARVLRRGCARRARRRSPASARRRSAA